MANGFEIGGGINVGRGVTVEVMSLAEWVTPAGSLGTIYAQNSATINLAAIASVGIATFAVQSGSSLPSGMTLFPNGRLSGTPATPGFYTFNLLAIPTPQGNETATPGPGVPRTFSLTVNDSSGAPVITWNTPAGLIASGWRNEYLTTTVNATSSDLSAITYSLAGGTLPGGMTLNSSTGVISGTPYQTAFTYTFTISASPASAPATSKSRQFQITIAEPVITWSTPAGSLGNAYANTRINDILLLATTNHGTVTYSLVENNILPPDLVLSNTGVISGNTATTSAGNWPFDVIASSVSDPDSTATQSFSFTVNPTPVITWTTPSGNLPNVYGNTSATISLTATVDTGNIAYTKTTGIFPTGLTLNSATGVISGFANAAVIGSYPVTITATSTLQSNDQVPQNFTINVVEAGANWNTPSGNIGGVNFVNSAITPITVSATPDAGNVIYGNVNSMPTGLRLNSVTGVITGTPTVAANAGIILSARSSVNPTGSANNRSFYINTYNTPVITWVTDPDLGTVQSSNTITPISVVANVNNGGLVYSIISGSLPPNLVFSNTGVISGTTTTATGNSTFIVDAVSTLSQYSHAAQSFTLGVTSIPTTTWATPAGSIGSVYATNPFATANIRANTTFGSPIYTITSGNLPAGMSLSSSTGAITGTPTVTGTSSFTANAISTLGGNEISRSFDLSVINYPTVTWNTPAGSLGNIFTSSTISPVTVSASASDSSAITYSIASGALPTGLSLNSSTGAITGNTSTTSGVSSFTINAVSVNGGTPVGQAFSLNVIAPTVTWTTPAGSLGSQYSSTLITPVQLQATADDSSNIVYSLSTGSLPTGLSLASATGIISGTTSNVGGTANFSIGAVSVKGGTPVDQAFSYTVNTPTVTWTTPSGSLGNVYASTPTTPVIVVATANDGSSITYNIASGNLPGGLQLNSSTGNIYGTTNANTGNSSFSLGAVSVKGGSPVARSFTYNVNPLPVINWVTSPTLSNIYTNSVANFSVVANVNSGSLVYSLASGNLPATLTLGNTGIISGNVTAGTSTANFSVKVTSNLVSTANSTQAFTLKVEPPPTITWTTPAGALSNVYANSLIGNITLVATASPGNVSYAVTTGNLPGNLSLDSLTGNIYGTTTPAPGNSAFTVTASSILDPYSNLGRAFTMTVLPQPGTHWVTPAGSLGNTYANVANTITVLATSTDGFPVYSVASGSLPSGMTLGSLTGNITGTPPTVGNSNFTLRAVSSNGGNSTDQSFSLSVLTSPVITWVTVAGNLGTIYSTTPTTIPVLANVTLGNVTYAVTTGTLPASLSLNSVTGNISGTVGNTAGTSNFTITATSTALPAITSPRAFSLTTAPLPTLDWTTPAGSLGNIYAGTAIGNVTLAATTTSGGLIYTVTTGNLPPTLSLASLTGVISGNTTGNTGVSNFTVTATSNLSSYANTARAFSFNVIPQPGTNWVTPAGSLGNNFANLASTITVVATTSDGSPVYSVASGNLPAGMSIGSLTGNISGTPTATGTANFTLSVVSTNGGNANTRAFSITTNQPPVITWVTPSGNIGSFFTTNPVSTSAVATVTTGNVTYAVTTGSLPPGLSLANTTGIIAGTLTSSTGLYNFTITATSTDLPAVTSPRGFNIAVNTIPVVTWSTPAGSLGNVYASTAIGNITLVANATSYGLTYAVASGNLPANLTLNANTGNISGTTTANTGISSFTVKATSTATSYANATQSFSMTVDPQPVNAWVTQAGSLGNLWANLAMTPVTVQATTSDGAVIYSVASGSLPSNVTINSSSGVISGTPNVAGNSTFTLQAVSNNGGVPATQAFSFGVNAQPVVNWQTSSGSLGNIYATAPAANIVVQANVSSAYPGLTYSVTTGALPANLTLTTYNPGAIALNGSNSYLYSNSVAVGNTFNFGTNVFTTEGWVYATSVTGQNQVFNDFRQTGNAAYLCEIEPAGNVIVNAGYIGLVTRSNALVNFNSWNHIAYGRTTGGLVNLWINGSLVGSSSNNLATQSNSALCIGSYGAQSGIGPGGYLRGNISQFRVSNNQVYTANSFSPTAWLTNTPNTIFLLNTNTSNTATTDSSVSNISTSVGGTVSWQSVGPGSGAVISGNVANITGTTNFSITATSNALNSVSATQAFSLTSDPAPIITWTTPAGSIGQEWANTGDQTLSVVATVTSGSVNYGVTTGNLPSGLSLNATTGIISGTPNGSAGTSNFTITAASNAVPTITSARAFSASINALPTIAWMTSAGSLGSANTNTTIGNINLLATVSQGGLTYSVSSGSLPPNLTLSNSGVISGTTSSSYGTFNFDIKATSNLVSTANSAQSFSFTVNTPATVTWSTPAGALGNVNAQTKQDVNSPFFTLSATASVGTLSYAVTSGSLPWGLKLDSSTGKIYGTSPATVTNPTFTVTASSSAGISSSRDFSIRVIKKMIRAMYYDVSSSGSAPKVGNSYFQGTSLIYFAFADPNHDYVDSAYQTNMVRCGKAVKGYDTELYLSLGGETAVPNTYNMSTANTILYNIDQQIQKYNANLSANNATTITGIDLDLEQGIDGNTIAALANGFKGKGYKISTAPQFIGAEWDMDYKKNPYVYITSGYPVADNQYKKAIESGNVDIIFVQNYNNGWNRWGFPSTGNPPNTTGGQYYSESYTGSILPSANVLNSMQGNGSASINIPLHTKIVMGYPATAAGGGGTGPNYSDQSSPFNPTNGTQAQVIAYFNRAIESSLGDVVSYGNISGWGAWDFNVDADPADYPGNFTAGLWTFSVLGNTSTGITRTQG